MPQIANLNNSPDFPKGGFLLAGTLKTDSSGKAYLYISGDWTLTSKPKGLVILCNARSISTNLAAGVGEGVFINGQTRLTFQSLTYGGANENVADRIIDYFIYVNTDVDNEQPLTNNEFYNVK